jgi:Fe-S-cluster-containing hydrogenase component 2
MMGLGPDQLLNVLSALEKRALHVEPRQCAKVRHRRSTCTRCADVCPTQAITWETSLQVDADKCTGCGLCAAVCPTGALEARDPADAELVVRVRDLAKERPAVTFACPNCLQAGFASGESCVRVSCLGRLDESVLVGSVAWGARELSLVDGACEACSNSSGREVAGGMVERSRSLLQALGVEAPISFVAKMPGAQPTQKRAPTATSSSGVSRRDFFGLFVGGTKKTAAVAVEAVLSPQEVLSRQSPIKRGEQPQLLPEKRKLLLAALRRLGQPVSPSLEQSALWSDVSFTQACNGCRMCAQFCPTGALRKVDEGLQPQLEFRLSHCTACNLCKDLCYWKAVSLSSSVDLDRVMADSAELLLEKGATEPLGLPRT